GEYKSELLSTRLASPELSLPSITLDIDGDGNMDLLTPAGVGLQIWYGHGNKNNLLTAVHDGADRRVDIEYSIETYEDPECVSEWPIQCLPKSPRPLVVRYTEAHAPLHEISMVSPAPYPEQSHTYTY